MGEFILAVECPPAVLRPARELSLLVGTLRSRVIFGSATLVGGLQRLGIGNGVLQPEAHKPRELRPIGQLIYALIVRQLNFETDSYRADKAIVESGSAVQPSRLVLGYLLMESPTNAVALPFCSNSYSCRAAPVPTALIAIPALPGISPNQLRIVHTIKGSCHRERVTANRPV